MNPHTIWRLDRLVGTPACCVLSVFEWFRRLFVRRPDGPPKRILFVKLIEMGSTVIAAPAFAEAAEMVGRENIFFLAFKQNRPIVDLLPYFPPENVLTIDDSNLITFLKGLWQARRRIRRERIDAAVDMEGLTRSSAMITYFSGAKLRVGYHNFTSEGPYRGRLFTHELAYNFQHHVSEMFVALVRALRAPAGQIPLFKEKMPGRDALMPPQFEPKPGEQDELREVIKRQAGRDDVPPKIVLLNSNCSDLVPLRRWPTESFVALGKRLLAHYSDVLLVITGAPAEREGAERLAEAIACKGRVAPLAGHTTLRQLLVLGTISSVLISNDSGPCHFAALTPMHILSLFGPETPQLYGPVSKRVTCLWAGLACSPCVNMLNHRFSPCNDNVCMQRITVDEVYDHTLKILDHPIES